MKKKKSAYVVDNVVENYEIIHSKCYVPPRATSDIYKNYFFVKQLKSGTPWMKSK